MAEWNETTSGDWNDGGTTGATVWADEPQVDEPANQFEQDSFEATAAPNQPAVDGNGRSQGIVKTWNTHKAFGFIGRDDGGPDVFCHIKNIKSGQALSVGDIVSYRNEEGAKGASATEVVVESAAELLHILHNPRETGTVKGWREEKGFGFIGRDGGGPDAFCHSKDIQETSSLTVGYRVSFRYEETPKGGIAKEVRVEKTVASAEEGPRETGTVVSWNEDKGFGFIKWEGEKDAFAHKRDVLDGKGLLVGQAVSFVVEEGAKGSSAKKIELIEGVEIAMEDESDRIYGKVKDYNEDKGFCFIARCNGQGDVFGHKRNFLNGAEPCKGMGVSFVLEQGDKGDSAMKIREEDKEHMPEMVLSDEGREFGTIIKWLDDKGFGYIQRKTGGEEAHVHARSCEGFAPRKGMCVSFVFEENDKGPTAKDVREEDPERVARVTAVRRYGVVKCYSDPPRQDLRNGFGFIVPTGPQPYGAPKTFYFHMDNITTPDEYGGLFPQDYVSFLVVPAKKGIQAIDVTLEDPPKAEEENQGIEEKIKHMSIGGNENEAPYGVAAGQDKITSKAEGSVEETGGWDLSAWN